MAKLTSKDKQNETPLGRTAQLARKLLAVPKAEVDKAKRRDAKRRLER